MKSQGLADQVRGAVMGRFPFKGIPVTHLAQLIEALMAHLPSVP
ncbi:hypothetical protein [Hyalangium sp.]|nr:hypothetical protein [Hyalangium sp.]HYI02815.1 hypothetical protein [Hyalangium sp.]